MSDESSPSRPRDLADYPPPETTTGSPAAQHGHAPHAGTRRTSLLRVFWVGAAAILVAAALVAIAAILRGGFSETDGKICGTLAVLLLCGGLAVAGLSLVERRVVTAFGWGSVVVAALALALLVAAIWQEFESETLARWAGTALVLVVVCLLVATSLLLLRDGKLLVVVAGEALALAVAALITIGGVWSDDLSAGAAKADAVFWILGVLGWILVPVLQRFTDSGANADAVRVLAELDGVELVASRLPVDGVRAASPGPGEQLSLRRRV